MDYEEKLQISKEIQPPSKEFSAWEDLKFGLAGCSVFLLFPFVLLLMLLWILF